MHLLAHHAGFFAHVLCHYILSRPVEKLFVTQTKVFVRHVGQSWAVCLLQIGFAYTSVESGVHFFALGCKSTTRTVAVWKLDLQVIDGRRFFRLAQLGELGPDVECFGYLRVTLAVIF